MQLYDSGLVISGKAFPFIWIPYSSVVKFDLIAGYGSKMDYRPSDMDCAKVIDLAYINNENIIVNIKLELASTLNVFNDHRTRADLIPFMKEAGIFDQFMI